MYPSQLLARRDEFWRSIAGGSHHKGAGLSAAKFPKGADDIRRLLGFGWEHAARSGPGVLGTERAGLTVATSMFLPEDRVIN